MAQFGAPNFLAAIDAYEAGANRREKNRLAEIDMLGRELQGKALQGDQNALAQLGQVNPEAYMQTRQFSDSQKRAFVSDFARSIYDADTPEKYAAVVQRFKAQGHNFDPAEEDFANRQSMLNQAIDIGQRMGLDLRREEAKRAQANSDRAYGLNVRQFDETKRMHDAQLAAASPDLVDIYDENTGQPYKARYNPQTGKFDRVGGVKAPNGTSLEVGPDGQVTFTQGMGKPLTEGQSKDVGYATRMADAVPIIDQMGEKLLSFGENVGGRVPLVGNYLKSAEYQQAEQAAGQWRQAFLRKDSGATITPQETADTNQLYIPQPGDKPELLRQKAKARRTATLAVKIGLPPKAVMQMQKEGIDLGKIINAPLPGSSGKSDQAPRIRTYNPETGELE